MASSSRLVDIFLDPKTLAIWAVIVVVTVLLLRMLYVLGPSAIKRNAARLRSDDMINVLSNALTCSEYTATAGGRLWNYFDADKLLLGSPQAFDLVSSEVVEQLKRYSPAKICFVEKDSGPVGMLSLASFVAERLGKPVSAIRVRRAVWKMAVKGMPITAGDHVVLIQDVMTTGFQLVRAAATLEKLKARIVSVIALVDREMEKDGDFVKLNVDLISLHSLSELVERFGAGPVAGLRVGAEETGSSA